MIKSIANSYFSSKSQKRFSFFKLTGLARQRRTLAELDDHMLNDIGITRAQAEVESDRPVWDAPDSWKR